METLHDVLKRHPDFDPRTGTDMPTIEEIYAANTMTYEEARAEQLREMAEADAARRRQKALTESERLAMESDRLRGRMRHSGVPERFLGVVTNKSHDLTGGRGVIIFGRQGSGKTTAAAGILKGWLMDNTGSARFTTGADMLTSLTASYRGRESEDHIMSIYERCDMLVIDDLGKENPTDYALTKLWQVIDARYGAMLPTIVTTQYSLDDLVRELSRKGGEQTALSIVSRLYETCAPVRMGDPDHRRQKKG